MLGFGVTANRATQRPIPISKVITRRNEMPTTLSKDEILDAIGTMSVFELAELIDAFKTKFNVTIAAAPVGGGPAAGGGGAAAAPVVEEKTEFDVILKEAGGKKIQ